MKIIRTGTNVLLQDSVKFGKNKKPTLSEQERYYLQQKIEFIKTEIERELAHPEEIMAKGIGAAISKRRADEAINFAE